MRNELARRERSTGLSNYGLMDPLFRMRSEMDRMMNGFLSLVPEGDQNSVFSGRGLISSRMNLSEDKDSYLVELELPGVKRDEVKVSIEDGYLYIEGERRNRNEKSDNGEESERKYHRVESSYGQFRQSIKLPADAQEDSVSAKFEDGILNITLGRQKERASRKEIPVEE